MTLALWILGYLVVGVIVGLVAARRIEACDPGTDYSLAVMLGVSWPFVAAVGLVAAVVLGVWRTVLWRPRG